MKDFYLYRGANMFTYAASIAATWIWAPAIFVASSKSYFDGIWGLLFFLVPNVLTLILFPFFAVKVREKINGLSVSDAINEADNRQKYLHTFISILILICSSAVQILGINTIVSTYFNISSQLSSILIAIAALLLVGKKGLKGSIITDAGKWFIMFIIGAFLVIKSGIDFNGSIRWEGLNNPDPINLLTSFGIPTMIGLLCAPYVDQTFWQRVFSIESKDIKPVFFISSILFGIIPLMFGVIGFLQISSAPDWNIAMAFKGNAFIECMLSICVLAALLSTLDSNLCAISSIVYRECNVSHSTAKFSMLALLVAAILILNIKFFDITELFLLYGTIRTCIALPTILIILNKYDKNRLFYITLATVIIAPLGFMISTDNKFIFTLIALLLPLLGANFNNERSLRC